MCAGVRYHDSFYVFAFGVDPAYRRQVRPQLQLVLRESADSLPSKFVAMRRSVSQCQFLRHRTPHERLCPQGYGKRIMFGIEVWVLEHGLPLKISATVDAAHSQLIAFYQSLGATIESSGKLWQLAPKIGSEQSPALRPQCCHP
jgi:hypothetical protein